MKQHTSALNFYKFKNISLHGTTSKYRFLFTFTLSTATLQLLAIWDGVISVACNNKVTIEQHTLTSCMQLLQTRIKSKLLQSELHLLMLIFVQKLILRKNRAFSFTFMKILFCSKTQHHSLIVLYRFSAEDRQIKWGRKIKPIYIPCNQSNGSRHHLDFACPYARLVWIIFYTSAKSIGLYCRVAAGIQLSKKDFQNKPFFQLVKHCLVCLSLFYLEGKLDVTKANAPLITEFDSILFVVNVGFLELPSVILPLLGHCL